MLTTPAHSVLPRRLRTGIEKRRSKAAASSVGKGEPPVSRARTLLRSASPGSVLSSVAIPVGTAASRLTRCRSTKDQ